MALVKMNIDEHPQIAGQLGIQSIPAVIAFDKGQPVDGFVGALPESQVRGFIERLVGPLTAAADELVAKAEAAAAGGRRRRRRGALCARADRGREQPQGDRRPGEAACRGRRPRSGQGGACRWRPRPRRAGSPTRRSPPRGRRCTSPSRPASVGDLAPLEKRSPRIPTIIRRASTSRWRSTPKATATTRPTRCSTIFKRDRKWNDEAARKQLLQFFEAWGLMDPAAVTARRKLSAILF